MRPRKKSFNIEQKAYFKQIADQVRQNRLKIKPDIPEEAKNAALPA